ncbi:MAG: cytochrome c oxidase assembly protein [Dehalococcoidia bacterium]|nr:cytochrome c oxidase assembly protein [Dehalococcoidia bacterium]
MALPVPFVEATTVYHNGPHTGPWQDAWSMDIGVMVPAAIAALLYARGLDRWVDRTRPHSVWRTLSYFAGLVLLVLSTQSPLDALAERHFLFHMVQHEVIMMVAVPLILLGAPTTPILLGLPSVVRKRVVAPLAGTTVVRALYRFLTNPVFAIVASTSIIIAWHLVPGWYVEALRNGNLHAFEHFTFVVSGVLAWWPVIDPRPLHARLSYPFRLAYLLALSTPRMFVAAFVAFAEEPIYIDWYGTVEPVLNISLADDQVLGGLIMWLPSQLLYLIAMAVVFFTWHAASESESRATAAATGERLAGPNPR